MCNLNVVIHAKEHKLVLTLRMLRGFEVLNVPT